MWFRNLYLFKFEQVFNLNPEELQNHLENNQLADCAPGQRESIGWVSPFGRHNDQLLLANQGFYLIRMARQERILPAAVIKEHLLERVDQIESGQDRKVGGKERRELREELEFELLPKAFTKTTELDAWIDSRNSWLVINTASAPRAETLAKLLRQALPNMSMSLPETESSSAALMTQWLNSGQPPRPFQFGFECLFKTADDEQSSVSFKKHELISDELKANLNAGKFVTQIELIWNDRIRFVLTDNLIIKRLKFLDVQRDDLDKQGFESAEQKIDTEFALMVGEVTQLWQNLTQVLQLKVK